MAGGEPTKGGVCTAADAQLCYKTCGPQSIGFKSETCTGGLYVEQSGCSFPDNMDYACYKIPMPVSATCPTTVPQASQACDVAECTPCNVGGLYADSGVRRRKATVSAPRQAARHSQVLCAELDGTGRAPLAQDASEPTGTTPCAWRGIWSQRSFSAVRSLAEGRPLRVDLRVRHRTALGPAPGVCGEARSNLLRTDVSEDICQTRPPIIVSRREQLGHAAHSIGAQGGKGRTVKLVSNGHNKAFVAGHLAIDSVILWGRRGTTLLRQRNAELYQKTGRAA